MDRLKHQQLIEFVQIGANDGIMADPISPLVKQYPDRFHGLVVEPLKDKFALLQRAYAGINTVIPVNVAIHNTESEMVIHRIKRELESKYDIWGGGLPSFDPNHYKHSHIPQSDMTTEVVPCMRLDALLAKYDMKDIELLVTDTEGYDFEILRSIDFSKRRPSYIYFEHGLSVGVKEWGEYKSILAHLTQQGYNVSHDFNDTLAFLPKILTR
jgi:FkbM family methyltransferase